MEQMWTEALVESTPCNTLRRVAAYFELNGGGTVSFLMQRFRLISEYLETRAYRPSLAVSSNKEL